MSTAPLPRISNPRTLRDYIIGVRTANDIDETGPALEPAGPASQTIQDSLDSVRQRIVKLNADRTPLAADLDGRKARIARIKRKIQSTVNAKRTLSELSMEDIDAYHAALRHDEEAIDAVTQLLGQLKMELRQNEQDIGIPSKTAPTRTDWQLRKLSEIRVVEEDLQSRKLGGEGAVAFYALRAGKYERLLLAKELEALYAAGTASGDARLDELERNLVPYAVRKHLQHETTLPAANATTGAGGEPLAPLNFGQGSAAAVQEVASGTVDSFERSKKHAAVKRLIKLLMHELCPITDDERATIELAVKRAEETVEKAAGPKLQDPDREAARQLQIKTQKVAAAARARTRILDNRTLQLEANLQLDADEASSLSAVASQILANVPVQRLVQGVSQVRSQLPRISGHARKRNRESYVPPSIGPTASRQYTEKAQGEFNFRLNDYVREDLLLSNTTQQLARELHNELLNAREVQGKIDGVDMSLRRANKVRRTLLAEPDRTVEDSQLYADPDVVGAYL